MATAGIAFTILRVISPKQNQESLKQKIGKVRRVGKISSIFPTLSILQLFHPPLQ